MAFPYNISLASSAKYIGFIDDKKNYNLNWDVVWSFTYALTGLQHGFCTYLTLNPGLTAYPGHYLGYPLLSSVVGIAFDSTGYFALSTPIRSGVPRSSIKANSLVIRDSTNSVIFNQALSALDTRFILSSSTKVYQTLRFRYSNAGKKLYVDYKTPDHKFRNLTSVTISSLQISDNTIVYPGFSFCSPISSVSITPSTMFVNNFHVNGNTEPPTYEIIPMVALTASTPTTFTLLSGISATPI
jgi:hypothetical protein